MALKSTDHLRRNLHLVDVSVSVRITIILWDCVIYVCVHLSVYEHIDT